MNMLEAALSYAARGWFVFPCRPGAKEPLGGRGHLDATTDPDVVREIWTRTPNANIGVAVAPSGLCIIDVDTAEGKPGLESLKEIEAQLPETLLARTGRGGYHGVFARPADMPPQRKIGLYPGIDLLGDGYAVVAPSVLANGGRYRWEREMPPALLPQFLREVKPVKVPQQKPDALGMPILHGGRNNALHRLACALRDTGLGREALTHAIETENRIRFAPPLPDSEVRTVIDSVMNHVTPQRDVAMGVIMEQEVRDIFADRMPEGRREWVNKIGKKERTPMQVYSTTFPELDKLIGGFSTQQLTGIIGTPSSGKSALIGHWLIELSKHRPVLHVSLELMRHELFIRYASHKLELPWKDGLYGRLDHDTMANAVDGMRICIMGMEDFDRNDPMGAIEEEVARMQAENNGIAPIVAIDYIQLMARGAATDMRHKVGDLTFRARQMAQRFDTVVLGVFTTQRFSYSGKTGDALKATDDPTAFLGAAKESGDIEFDCATLMFLDLDKLAPGARKPARIAVARCRVGDVGFVGLRADLAIGKFVSDPSALAEMSAEARQARKEVVGLEAVRNHLLEIIAAMPGRPWTDMRNELSKKCTWAKALEAKESLIKDGIIKEDERRDKGSKQKGRTLVVCEQNPAPSSRSEDEDV
mgnify:CR=1 FL=1